MHTFTLIFLVALATTSLLRLWLAQRQVSHVAAHRTTVPAEFAAVTSLTAHQKAADYTTAKTKLGGFDLIIGVLLTLAFTLGGGLEALSQFWGRHVMIGSVGHGIALIGSMIVLTSLVDLPLTIYRTFGIEARFGFNRMTWRLFVGDFIKSTVIGVLLGLPLLAAVLWLMGRMGTTWWLYVWLVWMVFNLLVLTLFPTVIAPLFNKFTPLADESLKTRIESLLERCGFRARGVFVMDGSKRSSHGNAYFTGFGAGKRIVFFDTLISRLVPAEIEAVLAHELGHFKRRHIVKRIVWLFGMSFVFLALLGMVIDQPWFYSALGVSTPSTAMALALFFLVVPVFTCPFAPIGSIYSRKHEYEADAYAAQQSNSGDLVRALVKLYQDNAATLTPDPLHSAFYDSHPPAALRIARLNALARPA